MRAACRWCGRAFQLLGMAALPFSLWIGFGLSDERASLIIFSASVGVFIVGTLLTRTAERL